MRFVNRLARGTLIEASLALIVRAMEEKSLIRSFLRMRCLIAAICILALTICIVYVPMISSIQKGISDVNGGTLLLAAESDADKGSGDEGDTKDEVPGIDRIGASVCYG